MCYTYVWLKQNNCVVMFIPNKYGTVRADIPIPIRNI